MRWLSEQTARQGAGAGSAPTPTTFAGLHFENVLVGLDVPDDAAVYKVSDDLAIVITIDFFTPIVDDPYAFGAIAAANSLSDIYAIGARPLVALNVAALPKTLPVDIANAIIRGGAKRRGGRHPYRRRAYGAR